LSYRIPIKVYTFPSADKAKVNEMCTVIQVFMTCSISDFVPFKEKCPTSKEICMRIPYGRSRLDEGNLITTCPVHFQPHRTIGNVYFPSVKMHLQASKYNKQNV